MSSIEQSSTFAITLEQEMSSKPYAVRAVDISEPQFKNRVSFKQNETVADVFNSVLVETIEGLLNKINKANMVFSVPDKIIETQGLILGRLRMLVSTRKDGHRSVIIRFAHFIGNFQNAFAGRFGFEAALANQKRLAETAAFFDIATPILNIVTALTRGALPHEAKAPLEKRLKQLHLDAEEFRFYLELLRRHTLQNVEEPLPIGPSLHPQIRIGNAG